MLQMIRDLPKLDAPRKVRIKFSKKGALIYISHLDLVRTMTRAIVRARIPVKYTEGFNPIPKLVFSTPLSVGCASECEYLDIKIEREMSFSEMKANLQNSLPKDIKVIDVYEPSSKFNDILFSSYEIRIKDPSLTVESAAVVLDKFSDSSLTVIKRTKSGEREVNILPYINSFECTGGDCELRILTTLSASSADYLNPEYIVNVVYDLLKLKKDVYNDCSGYTLVRLSLFLDDGKTQFR